ncbi:MAG: single-stranded DNA-binding protein [Blastocatellia bacterium]|nr:single-stranded DNA-binding protein [Blastocatellia bacterium]
MSFNKIIIVGYLGHNPDLRYTDQNTPVCTFSVATTEGKKDDPKGETTTWFRVTFWREKAELAHKYLEKGKQVYIEGRLRTRDWQDRDGITRTSLEVTGSELHFIDNRGLAAAVGASASGHPAVPSEAVTETYPATGTLDQEEIPF